MMARKKVTGEELRTAIAQSLKLGDEVELTVGHNNSGDLDHICGKGVWKVVGMTYDRVEIADGVGQVHTIPLQVVEAAQFLAPGKVRLLLSAERVRQSMYKVVHRMMFGEPPEHFVAKGVCANCRVVLPEKKQSDAYRESGVCDECRKAVENVMSEEQTSALVAGKLDKETFGAIQRDLEAALSSMRERRAKETLDRYQESAANTDLEANKEGDIVEPEGNRRCLLCGMSYMGTPIILVNDLCPSCLVATMKDIRNGRSSGPIMMTNTNPNPTIQ